MEPITLDVTLKDIEQAAPGTTTNPVARALQRMTGVDWVVMFGAIAVEAQPPHRIISLPASLHEQLKQFHGTHGMQPARAQITILPQSRAV